MATLSRSVVRFSRGVPPPEAVPSEELAKHSCSILKSSPHDAFAYPPIGGYLGNEQLRLALAERHDADPNAIFVGNGSLQVLDLITSHLVVGGRSAVIVERPTYDRALRIFARHAVEVVGVSLDVDGIDVDSVRREIRRRPPSFIYTIPDFQNPSGVTMSAERRIALIQLAETYDIPIVEDSPYRDLRYRGSCPPALAELACGVGVISVNSLSKVLSPGLRVGYAVSDTPTANALAQLAENTYLSPSPLAQAIAARALTRGLLDINIQRICELLRPRHDAAVAVVQATIPEALITVPHGGYFLGLEVRWANGERALLDAAQADGVSLVLGSAFYPPRSAQPRGVVFLRLPFQALEPDTFATGVERLAALLA